MLESWDSGRALIMDCLRNFLDPFLHSDGVGSPYQEHTACVVALWA